MKTLKKIGYYIFMAIGAPVIITIATLGAITGLMIQGFMIGYNINKNFKQEDNG